MGQKGWDKRDGTKGMGQKGWDKRDGTKWDCPSSSISSITSCLLGGGCLKELSHGILSNFEHQQNHC